MGGGAGEAEPGVASARSPQRRAPRAAPAFSGLSPGPPPSGPTPESRGPVRPRDAPMRRTQPPAPSVGVSARESAHPGDLGARKDLVAVRGSGPKTCPQPVTLAEKLTWPVPSRARGQRRSGVTVVM